MQDEQQLQLYCPHMAANFYVYVASCKSCHRQRPPQIHQKRMQLLLSSGPLELTIINSLYPVMKARQGKWFLVAMTRRYSKLKDRFPCSKVIASVVTRVCLEYRIVPYWNPETVLTNNGPQLVSKFLQRCACLWKPSWLQQPAST